MNTSTKTKKICTVAMLSAAAVILGIFSVRIGSGIKISFKFLPVFLTSVLFGPVWGGLCGGISDWLAWIFNPAGGYLPLISVIEFIYGVVYGLLLYKSDGLNKKSALGAVLCILINNFILSAFAVSYVLKDLLSLTYLQTVSLRIPSVMINTIIQSVGILYTLKYLPKIKKLAE